MSILHALITLLLTCFKSRSALALENLVLRQQLIVLKRHVKRPRLRQRDRLFWVLVARLWRNWRSSLILVQPETVIRWHRLGWRLFWRWKSRKKVGRPTIPRQLIDLIRRMSRDNVTWGAPRIRSELLLLGYDLAESTVAKYMVRKRNGPRSQGWLTFLRNHVAETVACDFFIVPSVTFRVPYVLIVLAHDRRRILHFAVTERPTAAWVWEQIKGTLDAEDDNLRDLLRDRDSIYGKDLGDRLKAMSIDEVFTAHRAPWQNPCCEPVIGTLRRECLDHVIVFNAGHLRRILTAFLAYYHDSRCHLSLGRNVPTPRDVQPPSKGRVIAIPQVGGLHHRYTRVA